MGFSQWVGKDGDWIRLRFGLGFFKWLGLGAKGMGLLWVLFGSGWICKGFGRPDARLG